jgi:hypothetical protein
MSIFASALMAAQRASANKTAAALQDQASINEPPRLARRELIAASVAPGLLCAVALVQAIFRNVHDLHAWRGGGFAMFSTFEHRMTVLHLFSPDRGECLAARAEVKVTPELQADLTALATLPGTSRSNAILDSVANSELEYHWATIGNRSYLSAQSRGDNVDRGDPVDVVAARVDVWRGRVGPIDCIAAVPGVQPCLMFEVLRSMRREK